MDSPAPNKHDLCTCGHTFLVHGPECKVENCPCGGYATTSTPPSELDRIPGFSAGTEDRVFLQLSLNGAVSYVERAYIHLITPVFDSGETQVVGSRLWTDVGQGVQILVDQTPDQVWELMKK